MIEAFSSTTVSIDRSMAFDESSDSPASSSILAPSPRFFNSRRSRSRTSVVARGRGKRKRPSPGRRPLLARRARGPECDRRASSCVLLLPHHPSSPWTTPESWMCAWPLVGQSVSVAGQGRCRWVVGGERGVSRRGQHGIDGREGERNNPTAPQQRSIDRSIELTHLAIHTNHRRTQAGSFITRGDRACIACGRRTARRELLPTCGKWSGLPSSSSSSFLVVWVRAGVCVESAGAWLQMRLGRERRAGVDSLPPPLPLVRSIETCV